MSPISDSARRATRQSRQLGMYMTGVLESTTTSPSYLRIVDSVLIELEEAILCGRIRPGERLIETSIADQLGVGRTTIREAFLMLQQRGLVVSVPRRGTFVTRITREDALDLAYSRALLECFAVRAGWARISPTICEQLASQIATMRTYHLPDDVPRMIKLDLAFHQTLVELANMPRLQHLWSSLNGQIGALFLRGIEEQEFDAAAVATLHERVLDAIRSGDPIEAQHAILKHYVRADQMASINSQALSAITESLGSFAERRFNGVNDGHDSRSDESPSGMERDGHDGE